MDCINTEVNTNLSINNVQSNLNSTNIISSNNQLSTITTFNNSSPTIINTNVNRPTSSPNLSMTTNNLSINMSQTNLNVDNNVSTNTANSYSSLSPSNTSSVIRPALSWCSKCGQSTEISSESKLHNNKTNYKFRKTFNLEESEVLIKSFSCALVDDMLFQGTLYASQNYFSFFARIANKTKKVILAVEKVTEITKEKTAGIFPNAIAVKTKDNRFLFSSFVHREVAFRCLKEVWASHQGEKFQHSWLSEVAEEESYDEDISENPDKMNYPEVEYGGSPALPIRKIKPKQKLITRHNESVGDQILTNFRILVSKEQIQLFLAIFILIILTFYIIILAWRIHDFQKVLMRRLVDQTQYYSSESCEFSKNSNTGDTMQYCSNKYQNNHGGEPTQQQQQRQQQKHTTSGKSTIVSKRIIDDLKQSLNELNNLLKMSNRILSSVKLKSMQSTFQQNIVNIKNETPNEK